MEKWNLIILILLLFEYILIIITEIIWILKKFIVSFIEFLTLILVTFLLYKFWFIIINRWNNIYTLIRVFNSTFYHPVFIFYLLKYLISDILCSKKLLTYIMFLWILKSYWIIYFRIQSKGFFTMVKLLWIFLLIINFFLMIWYICFISYSNIIFIALIICL